MHCQTEQPIPLKDTSSETVEAKYSFMDFPDLDKKQAASQPKESEKEESSPIVPHDNDILLGRGGKNNMHVGNEKLRELARKVAEQYHRSSKKEKSYLSRTLVQKVKEMDPPGRFLRRHPKENHWEDMSEDEDKCREKCAQVLRDAVAFVGLKESPAPSMAQREQQLHHNPFSMRRSPASIQAHLQQYQQPMMQMNPSPFAMSASSASQIMRHQQQLLAGSRDLSSRTLDFSSRSLDLPSAGIGRQFSFPTSFHAPQLPRNSLAPSTGSLDAALGSPSTAYASLPQAIPQSVHLQQGAGDGSFRAPKRRRLSNPYFDPFATLPPTDPPASFGGLDRRLSVASNSYPIGSDFPHMAPGPRARRDSVLGNTSLGPLGSDHHLSLPAHGSDHSGPSLRDFELFPDIAENPDCGGSGPKNDSDEFASDFC